MWQFKTKLHERKNVADSDAERAATFSVDETDSGNKNPRGDASDELAGMLARAISTSGRSSQRENPMFSWKENFDEFMYKFVHFCKEEGVTIDNVGHPLSALSGPLLAGYATTDVARLQRGCGPFGEILRTTRAEPC